MPEHLRRYIDSLSVQQAEELLGWLKYSPHRTSLAILKHIEKKMEEEEAQLEESLELF